VDVCGRSVFDATGFEAAADLFTRRLVCFPSFQVGGLSMRALCGAIVTAGAVIGLGLTALAFGTRYGQTVGLERNAAGAITQLHLYEMDKPLVFILIFLTAMALIGLAITFLGLAYHHHRRHQEMLHHERLHPATPTVS
jgi:hypothetical protein